MQIVSFYIFNISQGKKLKAFTKMAFFPNELKLVEGCSFAKMMGSGHGQGFSIRPNFGIYAAMMVWDDPKYIHKFESSFKPLLEYQKNTSSTTKIYATPYKFHGTWDNKTPFKIIEHDFTSIKRLVLTRATIKPTKLIHFWKHVPKTSKAIEEAKGRLYSIGIGELPWIQQATLSIWESEEAMKEYAYSNKSHIEAIQLTKKLDWYKEEMFTRFYELSNFIPEDYKSN